MSTVLMEILKGLGSKILMLLLEEGIKELKNRDDNTVGDEAVEAIAAIRQSNVFADDTQNV